VHSDEKISRIVTGGFGCEIAHEAVSRRPPISLPRIVARTHMYTYAANVWDLSIVHGPFSVAPCQTLVRPFASLYRVSHGGRHWWRQAWARWHTLVPHRTAAGWMRRLAIVHSDKLLLAAACYASLASPDLLGLVLQLLMVAGAPRRDSPSSLRHFVRVTAGVTSKGRFHLPCEPPPGPLSISYGHVRCLKARAFPPPV
jgi:hypothetical protein